jgi:integrase
MTRIKLEYVHEYRDRHGKVRRYVRRPGSRRVALPGLPGSSEFMQAYQDAISGPVVRPRAPKAGTLAALAAEFFNSTEFANLKPSSQATYRLTLGPILERDGHRLVRDLPADKARKIIQEIGATRPAMANLTRAVLRRMFSFAVAIGQRRDNPFNAVRLAFDVLLYSAQRVGDVVRMQRSDIRNGVITVVQQKTDAEVFVPLHPALARSIKAGPSKGIYLIGNKNGPPITRRTLSVLISGAAKAAGLPAECVAHGLRKAALRRLAEHGATSKEMQAISGHKTLAEIERYTQQADQRRLARAAIGALPDKD